jgi:hypothetical protein
MINVNLAYLSRYLSPFISILILDFFDIFIFLFSLWLIRANYLNSYSGI